MSRLRELFYFAIVSSLLSFSVVSTGEGEERVLSLPEAVNLALANNPLLKAAENSVEGAKARVGQARSGLLPSIDVYEDFSRTNNPMMAVGSKLNQERFSSRDYELSRLNNPPPISNLNTRFVFTQPIFDQGKTLVGMKQAKLNQEAAERVKERVKQEVIFNVVKGFSGVMMAKEDLSLATETENVAVAHVKLAEDLFQYGQVVKSDLLSAKVRVCEVREMVLQAENGLTIAQAALNQAMGTKDDDGIEVTADLDYEAKQVDSATVLREALEKRPDLLALERTVSNAEEGIKLAKTNYLPSFNFLAHYDLNDENDIWKTSGESWTIGGMFHLNLFDGLNTSYKVREARDTAKQLENQEEELRNRIAVEVKQAVSQLHEAEERMKVASEAINHAEESLRIVEDRYQAGLSTMVELLDNEVALTRAKRNHLKALDDFRVASAGVELARGTLAPPQ